MISLSTREVDTDEHKLFWKVLEKSMRGEILFLMSGPAFLSTREEMLLVPFSLIICDLVEKRSRGGDF